MKRLLFCWAMTGAILIYVFLTPLFFTPFSVPVKFPKNYELFYGDNIMQASKGLIIGESIDGIIKRSETAKNKMIMEATNHWGMGYWLADNGVLYHAQQQIPLSWWNFLQFNTRYDRGAIIISGGGWFHYSLGILVAAIFFLVGAIFIKL